jgi:hypothetical protein
MPADALLPCFVMLPWVRLEARPFHIPPRIALLGWSVIVREPRWKVSNPLCKGKRLYEEISDVAAFIPFEDFVPFVVITTFFTISN